ncbi:MAG: beta-N-acetylhexosaminidase [Pseudomonadota bacterium]
MPDKTWLDIGQYFIIGVPGTAPSGDFYKFIKEYNIGGVLFLGKNYDSPENLVNLVNSLQEASPVMPLFTCVDHEGGRVQRFKAPFTVLPAFRKFAETKTSKEIFEIFNLVARELLACGINFNFAPVADMTNETGGVIGDRSLGTDVAKVDEVISAVIRGFVKSGILCCVKHFPGHGCTTIDSHEKLPESDKTLEELMSYEILPFKRATRAGVHSIMPAHILFKNIDSVPASLSKIFIQKVIRQEFRFIKLVITDDISMGAITKHFSPEEASKLAINAGNDLIIYSSSDINHLATLIENLRKYSDTDSEMKNNILASGARIKEMKKNISRSKIDAQKAVEFLNLNPLKQILSQ